MSLDKTWLNRFSWPQTLETGHSLAIAHRGASDHAPENTLKAFQIAADLYAEMWELDVRLSVDGVCVVAHDDNLARMAGQELRVSAASWYDISALQLPEGQQVPRLEEVIELAVQTGCGLYIEIKSEDAGVLAWELLQKSGLKFAVLASFNVSWVRQLRDLGCKYPLAVLVPNGADPIEYLGGLDADIVHLCWRDTTEALHELLTESLINSLVDHGLQIVIWHEDRPAVLHALWDLPIMGICSNRPELLKPYVPNPAHNIDIVCHRGANNLAPENTLEAARICLDQGFQYIELDVRTTADDELVVIHDAELLRTTSVNALVMDKTLAEIQSLDAGGWFREGAAGYHVPSLNQMLAMVKGYAGLYIDVKLADPEKLLQLVKAHGMLDKCFFWGGDIAMMNQLRNLEPDVVLMAPRWMYASVKEAHIAYGAQIIEFDVERDNLAEIAQCQELGARSMIFSKRHQWGELASYLKYKPDLLNLSYPDRFKILASYPRVYAHFQTTVEG